MPRFESKEQIAEHGPYQLWDGPTAVDKLMELIESMPLIDDIVLWAQLPGESVESGSRRIEYVAEHVIPEVTRRLSA